MPENCGGLGEDYLGYSTRAGEEGIDRGLLPEFSGPQWLRMGWHGVPWTAQQEDYCKALSLSFIARWKAKVCSWWNNLAMGSDRDADVLGSGTGVGDFPMPREWAMFPSRGLLRQGIQCMQQRHRPCRFSQTSDCVIAFFLHSWSPSCFKFKMS